MVGEVEMEVAGAEEGGGGVPRAALQQQVHTLVR
jgi:hypothetical protein